jgi:F-type H+/Na+-transporting ATPase subunit alpha
LKLELAQFRELEAFMQFASDLDKGTADRIASGQRMVEVLKQKNGQPIPLEKQVAMIFIAGKGYLNETTVNKVTEVEKQFTEFLDNQYSAVLGNIKSTGQLSDESKEAILKAGEEFKLAHPELFPLKQ